MASCVASIGYGRLDQGQWDAVGHMKVNSDLLISSENVSSFSCDVKGLFVAAGLLAVVSSDVSLRLDNGDSFNGKCPNRSVLISRFLRHPDHWNQNHEMSKSKSEHVLLKIRISRAF